MAYVKIQGIRTGTHLKQSLDYIKNPDKTDRGILISSFVCSITTQNTKHNYQANFTMVVNICKKFYCQINNINSLNVETLIKKYILPVRENKQKGRKSKINLLSASIYRVV